MVKNSNRGAGGQKYKLLRVALHFHGVEWWGKTAALTGKVNRPVVVGINLVDHILQLGLRRVLTERSHNGTQLLRSDLS